MWNLINYACHQKLCIIKPWGWILMNSIRVEGILSTNMFTNIREKEFSKKKRMFCNGLNCFERKIKCSNFVPKLSYLVLLDKIILVVLWPYAERLLLNGLLESCSIFASTKLGRKASRSKNSPMGCRTMSLQFIPGHRPFLLRPSLGTGLSY